MSLGQKGFRHNAEATIAVVQSPRAQPKDQQMLVTSTWLTVAARSDAVSAAPGTASPGELRCARQVSPSGLRLGWRWVEQPRRAGTGMQELA
jgi:hypothetical protein